MIPFFYQDLSVLIRKIMEIIVKPKVMSDCNAAINLKRISLNESNNLLNDKVINIGFCARKMLLDLPQKDLITAKEHSPFLKDFKHFIISFLSKLFEITPQCSVKVRCSSIFKPANLVVNELDDSK